MFFHNFKYTLKSLLKNRALIFWTLAFPVILATFFNLAFSSIEENSKLKVINIAVVDDENYKQNEVLKESFKVMGDKKNKDQIFSITYTSVDKAKDLLEKEEIDGYLKVEEKPEITIKQNGINQTIFKYITNQIIKSAQIANDITEKEVENQIKNGNFNINYEEIYIKALTMANQDNDSIEDKSNKNMNYMVIEFYTLIAMTCLYCGTLAMSAINNTLPNMSKKGMRVASAPVSKWNLIVSSLLASYIVQLIGLAILFIYTIFVLHIDYGDNFGGILLLSLIGSLSGLSLGVLIGSAFKASEGTKIGIMISVSMFCCFLSGMMGVTMKYVIDKNVPLVNLINPGNMITDGFYALYYYETFSRFWFDIVSLIVFSTIIIFFAFISLRRQKYDSI